MGRSTASRLAKPCAVRPVPKPADLSGLACAWSAVGGCVIFRVAGEVDAVAAPAFRAELHRVITTKRPTVVVDLRRITFMDSAGVHVLADAHDLAVEHGGWIRLAGGEAWLISLTRTAGLDRQLPHYPTLSEALPLYRPAVVDPARSG
jgi:anti-anti-sigma factor